jgi:hypothetical protein
MIKLINVMDRATQDNAAMVQQTSEPGVLARPKVSMRSSRSLCWSNEIGLHT